MSIRIRQMALEALRSEFERLSELERRVVDRIVEGHLVSRNTNLVFDDKRTIGQRVADRVAAFGGSWTFILSFGALIAAWVLLNSVVLARAGDAFDSYPYILLNLFLSLVASLQAPVIMMSQNRQAAKDRLDASHDYEVNLKAELEIRVLQEKFDELREHRWAELVAQQQEQIRLLTALLDAQSASRDVRAEDG